MHIENIYGTFMLGNPAATANDPLITDQDGKLHCGRIVGSVTEVIDCVNTPEGPEYNEAMYVAYQLITGPIIAVEWDKEAIEKGLIVNCHSLKNRMFSIWFGMYPIDIPEKWKGLLCVYECSADVNTDELPF